MPPEAPAQPLQSNDPDASNKPLNGSPSLYSLRTITVASARSDIFGYQSPLVMIGFAPISLEEICQ
ncbi:hypothetical protein RSAG8_01173, partial [Rhizoctonia solani AG-8 WAC10335]